jgi:hypothetical protein
MRFRDGTFRHKALFAALVGVYLLGLLLAFTDRTQRRSSSPHASGASYATTVAASPPASWH